MATFEAAVEVRAGPEVVFDWTHDYGRRLEWDPLLREARLLGGATEAGVGVRSLCVGKGRLFSLGMECVYIVHERPWRSAVKMTRGSRVFERFAASIRHEVVAEGVTRVVYRGHVATRPRWLRPVMEPIAAFAFRAETRRRLAALRRVFD